MREANAAFVAELQHGKGFIADFKVCVNEGRGCYLGWGSLREAAAEQRGRWGCVAYEARSHTVLSVLSPFLCFVLSPLPLLSAVPSPPSRRGSKRRPPPSPSPPPF